MFLITCLDLSVNQELTLADHIGWLSVSRFHSLQQLRDIRRHRQHLSECCRCQSDLLQCVHNVYLRQLQTVVSATAQLIICKQKYDHISATIWDVLHWLPIHQRVEFLTVHAVFNCLHNLANLSTMCLSVTENPRLVIVISTQLLAAIWLFQLQGQSLPSSQSHCHRMDCPMWHSLPVLLHSCHVPSSFCHKLKPELFNRA